MLSTDITSNSKFPNFIRHHEAFRQQTHIHKIFPYIGLNNFKTDIKKAQPTLACISKLSAAGARVCLDRECLSPIKRYGAIATATTILLAEYLLDMTIAVPRFRRKPIYHHLTVHFSSSGEEGMWDIATMSMRGLSSCQSWIASRKRQLVGSMLDPCCAIMYISDDTRTGYGNNMLYRSIVRYTVNEYVGPCLFMEQIYSKSQDDEDIRAANVMMAYLLNTKSGLPVIYNSIISADRIKNALFIPHTSAVENSYPNLSYRDSQIEYKIVNQDLYSQFPKLNSFRTHFSLGKDHNDTKNI